jgi:hypothetical protein
VQNDRRWQGNDGEGKNSKFAKNKIFAKNKMLD